MKNFRFSFFWRSYLVLLAILLPTLDDIYNSDVVLSSASLGYTLKVTDFFNRILGLTNPQTGVATNRVVAFDLARGLAILGMFTAHMWVDSERVPDLPLGFPVGLSHGRSAPLFAVLAGVSLGIISDSISRRFPPDNPELSRKVLRRKLVMRALYLIGIAAVLALFNERILLILDNYGIWFLATIPLLGLSSQVLFVLVVFNLTAGVVVFHYLQTLSFPYLVSVGLGLGDYSFPVYLSYVLAGMILWRAGWAYRLELLRHLALWATIVAVSSLALGTALDSLRLGRVSLAWLGMETYNSIYLVPASESEGYGEYPDLDLLTPGHWQFWYNSALYLAPHTDSTLEAVANLGWSVALVSLLLLLPARLNRVVAPVAALGSMALTAYSLHIVWHSITWKTFGSPGLFPSFVFMTVVFLLLASLWRLRFRRGPLEAFFHWLTV